MPESSEERITPLILVGGKSQRMGTNKSFVLLDGKPMLEVVLSIIRPLFSHQPILVANSSNLYAHLNLPIVEDIYKEKGPLGGIHAALSYSSTPYIFVFGCDMPFLQPALIEYMVNKLEDEDILIPRDGKRIEPLHAIYSKNCLPAVEAQIRQGSFKIQSFFSQVRIKYLEKEDLAVFGQSCFSNINNQEELVKAQRGKKNE